MTRKPRLRFRVGQVVAVSVSGRLIRLSGRVGYCNLHEVPTYKEVIAQDGACDERAIIWDEDELRPLTSREIGPRREREKK